LKNNIFYTIICALFINGLFAQSYNINFSIADYENDTLIVGYYYGDKQLVKDTVFATKKGEFSFKGNEKLGGGMYLGLMKPDNSFVQFLVGEADQNFDIKFSKKDVAKVAFKNSKENTLFYEYMEYIRNKSKEAEPLRDTLKKDDPATKAKLAKLDVEVKAYQKAFLEPIKGSILYNLINSNNEIDIPEYTGTEEEKQMSRYRFYKAHYFDYIDWNLPSLIRTPYIHNKIDFYVKKLTVQNPDSLILSVDYILKQLEKNEDARKYYLSHFLNEYANAKIIGMDKIFVHLTDNYYAKGQATWVKEDNLKKIIESADNLRNILIGNIFPNITTYKEDNTPVILHNVKSKYTLLVFWAPDCGHCKKEMPDVLKYAAEYKNLGLTTISVCTKGGDKAGECWEGVKEKSMEALINTGDEYQRYRQLVSIQTTPKLFLLDDKKEIIFKDMPAEELGNVMKDVIRVEEEKAKMKKS
jgi:thiol-disulfide isomerase/thioredoxin